jgi:competence/damage-inducible protein CinA-like protein
MDLEIVTIGTELLLGQTIDTNAAYLARALTAVGARVTRKTSVPDNPEAIRDAVGTALGRTGLAVTSGGLGPTRDDRTRQAVADLFGVPLLMDETYLGRLEARWRGLGRPGAMPDANRTQAQYPAGATILPNPRGSAPGLWLEGPLGVVVLLPGVPHEFQGLTDEEVVPRLGARAPTAGVTRSLTLRTTGIPESQLADLVGPHENALAPATLAYLPTFEGVDLRITAWQMAADAAEAALAHARARLLAIVGDRCYGEGGTDLASVVLDQVGAAGGRLAVAESCTGGLVASRLTAIPGASTVFAGGIVAYDNAIKVRELEVPERMLRTEGAVSEAVVRAMAEGAQRRFGARAAIAVTGIAGPGGGSDAKPVGTVWLCAAWGADQRAIRIGFPGDRGEIRGRATQTALDLLRRALSGSPPAAGR